MAQLNDTVITGSLSVTDKINGPIADVGNGAGITFAYSKAGVTNPDWLGAWNGYELRAVLRSNLNVGSANDLASGAVLSKAKGGTGVTSFDNIPTENSEKPVTSGGLYDNVTRIGKFKRFTSYHINASQLMKEIDGVFYMANDIDFVVTYNSSTFSKINIFTGGQKVNTINSYKGLLFAGTDANGLWQSTDNSNFTQNTALSTSYGITVLTKFWDYLIVGTKANGLYYCNNATNSASISFSQVANTYIPTTSCITAICTYYSDNKFRLFVGTKSNGLYYQNSIDITFTRNTSFPTNIEITDIKTFGGNIFIGTKSNGLYYSDDGITFYQNTSLDTSFTIKCLYSTEDKLYVGTEYNGLWESDDGVSFYKNTEIPQESVYSIYSLENKIWVSTEYNLYYSFNTDFNYLQNIDTQVSNFLKFVKFGNKRYMFTTSGIYELNKNNVATKISNTYFYSVAVSFGVVYSIKSGSSTYYTVSVSKNLPTYTDIKTNSNHMLLSSSAEVVFLHGNTTNSARLPVSNYNNFLEPSTNSFSGVQIVFEFKNNIYLGKTNGLSKYRNYTTDTSVTLPVNYRINIACCYRGKLFISSNYTAFGIYESSDGDTFSLNQSFPAYKVNKMIVYKGNLYVCTEEHGVYTTSDGSTFTQLPASCVPNTDSIDDAIVYNDCLYLHKKNSTYIHIIQPTYDSTFVNNLNDLYINKKVAISDLKSIVANSSDFADFQSKIALL